MERLPEINIRSSGSKSKRVPYARQRSRNAVLSGGFVAAAVGVTAIVLTVAGVASLGGSSKSAKRRAGSGRVSQGGAQTLESSNKKTTKKTTRRSSQSQPTDSAGDGGVVKTGAFEAAVANLRRAGFHMEPGERIRSDHIASAIGVKSDGDEDIVVCVSEFVPFKKSELEGRDQSHEAVIARRELHIRVNSMYASIAHMPDAIRSVLQHTNGPQSEIKHTNNGTTHFVGVMLVGTEQCQVNWAEELRWLPSSKMWTIDYQETTVMFGPDDYDFDPAATQLIRQLLTGGRGG
jgi:hypothetical protein